MSVLIKDMQIPDNCDVCLFSDWSNLHQTSCCKLKEYEPGFQDYSIAYRTQRSNICPLVDIPEHHGRLIDADFFKEHLYACATNGRPLHRMYQELNELLEAINDIPTVIEAE